MITRTERRPVFFMVALAFTLWVIAFALPYGNFWVKISLSAFTLACLSLILRREIFKGLKLNPGSILIGVAAAAALYLIFMAGREISLHLFGFAGEQISGIYEKGAGTPSSAITLLLFFITGPGEEIFWRGYLQKVLQGQLGDWKGYALATALYAAVHICSMNFILVGAAAVAGAFWGALYWRTNNLAAVVISHSIWSTVVFAILPLH